MVYKIGVIVLTIIITCEVSNFFVAFADLFLRTLREWHLSYIEGNTELMQGRSAESGIGSLWIFRSANSSALR